MKTRRIAIVSDAVMPFNNGGKEMRIHHLTQGLVQHGFQVDIYTMQWWEKGNTYSENGVTFHAICRLHPLYAGTRRSISQAILFGLSCLKMVRYNYDILEVDHMPYFPLFSMKLVALIKHRPLYATWHEVWGKAYWQSYLGRYLGLLAYSLERLSVMMPNHIIVVSKQTQQELRSVLRFRGPMTLISNAVDTKGIGAIPKSATSTDILYAGRLLSHKNVDLLIKAIHQIVPEFPDLYCEIIGGGPEKGALATLIQDLDLTKHVVMRGLLPSNNDVIAQMKSTKIFASPSSREGFGITILEALACGSRVVTVNHPGNAGRFLVDEAHGTVCEPTVDSLATALSKELRLASKQSRTEATQQYDWSASAKKLSEAYAS